jgi:hypothetical protein
VEIVNIALAGLPSGYSTLNTLPFASPRLLRSMYSASQRAAACVLGSRFGAAARKASAVRGWDPDCRRDSQRSVDGGAVARPPRHPVAIRPTATVRWAHLKHTVGSLYRGGAQCNRRALPTRAAAMGRPRRDHARTDQACTIAGTAEEMGPCSSCERSPQRPRSAGRDGQAPGRCHERINAR